MSLQNEKVMAQASCKSLCTVGRRASTEMQPLPTVYETHSTLFRTVKHGTLTSTHRSPTNCANNAFGTD